MAVNMNTDRAQGPGRNARFILAADHRDQFEKPCGQAGAGLERLTEFKLLLLESALLVGKAEPGVGMILDRKYGGPALALAHRSNLWVAAPIEVAGSRPLSFEGAQPLAAELEQRPQNEVIKCLCHYDLADPPELRTAQERSLITLNQACQASNRTLLVEIIPPRAAGADSPPMADILNHLYGLNIRPHYWKLEPQSDHAWKAIAKVIENYDPACLGVLILGKENSHSELMAALERGRRHEVVSGFAIGRAIHGEVLVRWMAREITDKEAVTEVAGRFSALVDAWKQAGRATQEAGS